MLDILAGQGRLAPGTDRQNVARRPILRICSASEKRGVKNFTVLPKNAPEVERGVIFSGISLRKSRPSRLDDTETERGVDFSTPLFFSQASNLAINEASTAAEAENQHEAEDVRYATAPRNPMGSMQTSNMLPP